MDGLVGVGDAQSAQRPEGRVFVVGAGGIGRALIDLLAPLGARVVAVTRSGRDVAGAVTSVASDRLHDVLPGADHVVVLAPATARTRHLIGAAELALLTPLLARQRGPRLARRHRRAPRGAA